MHWKSGVTENTPPRKESLWNEPSQNQRRIWLQWWREQVIYHDFCDNCGALLPHDIAVKLCCTPLCDKDRFVLPQDKHGQFTFVRGNRKKPNLNALKLHTQSPGSLVLTRIPLTGIPLTGILVTYFPSGIKFNPTEMMTSCRDLIIPLGSGFDFL